MIRLGRIVLFLFCGSNNFALQPIDTLPLQNLARIDNSNQCASYIPSLIGIANLEQLMTEADLNAKFVIQKQTDSRLMLVFKE